MIPHLYAECGEEHHFKILEAINQGKKPAEIAEDFKVHVSTVRRVKSVAAKRESFDLTFVDGITKCPIAKITTAHGFEKACKVALRKWGGFFSDLHSRNWELVAGDRRIKGRELMSQPE